MLRMFMALVASIRAFAAAQRGAAVVEFALVVPVLLTLYLGSLEASSLFTVDRRITTISSTMGDLVARADGTITQAAIDDYFKAAEGILIPYPTSGLNQVVSLISVADDGATSVVWSRASPGATARSEGDSYPIDASAQINIIAREVGYLVASETSYAYSPVLGAIIPGPIDLYRESFYLPRFGAEIAEPTS